MKTIFVIQIVQLGQYKDFYCSYWPTLIRLILVFRILFRFCMRIKDKMEKFFQCILMWQNWKEAKGNKQCTRNDGCYCRRIYIKKVKDKNKTWDNNIWLIKRYQYLIIFVLKGNFAIFYMLAKYVPGDMKYIFTKFYRHISTNNEANRKGVGMTRVDFGPISETVYIDIILNTIIAR